MRPSRALRRFLPCALALLVAAACGDSDPAGNDDDDDPVVPILVIGTDMGVRFQNIALESGGVALEGATVTVNGETMTESSPGRYGGQLSDALEVGETLTLRIESDGRVVVGTAVIVDAAPTLTAPVANQYLDRGNDLAFVWTAADDPDSFRVSVAWVADGGGTSTRVEVDGASRSGSVPTAAVPDDATEASARIHAYLRGTFTGPVDPDSDMNVRVAGRTVDLSLEPPITVTGFDMGTFTQNVRLESQGAPLEGATVTANGAALAEFSPGLYRGTLPATLQPGESLVLRVESAGRVVEGTAMIVASATLTTPVAGQNLNRGTPMDFAWTAPDDPILWRMGVSWVSPAGGSSARVDVPGSARSGQVPTDAVPGDATSAEAYVFGYLRGTFTGPVTPESDMRVRLGMPGVDLTIN
ncbi:MAG: hypothetical protein RLN75_04245 [Longimicrobiales bacterium]